MPAVFPSPATQYLFNSTGYSWHFLHARHRLWHQTTGLSPYALIQVIGLVHCQSNRHSFVLIRLLNTKSQAHMQINSKPHVCKWSNVWKKTQCIFEFRGSSRYAGQWLENLINPVCVRSLQHAVPLSRSWHVKTPTTISSAPWEQAQNKNHVFRLSFTGIQMVVRLNWQRPIYFIQHYLGKSI